MRKEIKARLYLVVPFSLVRFFWGPVLFWVKEMNVRNL